jgi:hypothetical protein
MAVYKGSQGHPENCSDLPIDVVSYFHPISNGLDVKKVGNQYQQDKKVY